MKILPTELTSRGFTYRQILREGDFAIYSQSPAGSTGIIAYEVIIVQRHNGYSIAGNDYPPAEYYPRTEDWGRLAWTVSGRGDKNLEYAKALMREAMAAQKEKRAEKAKKAKKAHKKTKKP